MSVVPVVYDSWQLECCGEPFAVGDTVIWRVASVDAPPGWPDELLSDGRLLLEDHHDVTSRPKSMRGVVRRIRVLSERFERTGDRAYAQVGGPVALRDVERSPESFDSGPLDGPPSYVAETGLVVDLER